jgi:acyl carrier protein
MPVADPIPRFQGEPSMPSRDEIFEKVKAALVEALGVDEEDVNPEATMVGDLGAESIDFLDIVFRLEKAFGIKISRGELFPEDVLSSTEFVANGKVNAAGIAALKARMPFANLAKFEANPSVQNFANTLTVEDMVRYVTSKIAG